MFYVLGSLEIIAEEVENPFGTDANDLPTDELAKTIAGNVAGILVGESGSEFIRAREARQTRFSADKSREPQLEELSQEPRGGVY
jgi:predicted membrane chloride channel (bestrophin family)